MPKPTQSMLHCPVVRAIIIDVRKNSNPVISVRSAVQSINAVDCSELGVASIRVSPAVRKRFAMYWKTANRIAIPTE